MSKAVAGRAGGGVGGVDMLGAETLFRFCERGVVCEGLGDVSWR